MYTMAGIGVAIGVSGIYISNRRVTSPALPYSTSSVTCAVVFGITKVGVTGGGGNGSVGVTGGGGNGSVQAPSPDVPSMDISIMSKKTGLQFHNGVIMFYYQIVCLFSIAILYP